MNTSIIAEKPQVINSEIARDEYIITQLRNSGYAGEITPTMLMLGGFIYDIGHRDGMDDASTYQNSGVR